MKRSAVILILAVLCCCSRAYSGPAGGAGAADFIRGADLSSLPEIEEHGTLYYNRRGRPEDPLVTMSNNGMNTVRLRVWHTPPDGHCGFDEVESFSARIHGFGLGVWLAVHYSDSWADPAHQVPPAAWKGIPFEAVEDSVYSYTGRLASAISPQFIQIGNEINHGLLLPEGRIEGNEKHFLRLISAGVRGVRDNSPDSEIIIHYAGISGADRFFGRMQSIDYDIMGISYYPRWHGKDLLRLKRTLARLSEKFGRDILIAETAYPFTLGWNDMTHNVVGLKEQLILPEFPATPEGQADFLTRITEMIRSLGRGRGFCYWGGELVACEGPESTYGSHWENQALYDFDCRALPAVEVFGRSRK
jgi:arabinogalactan endo-1,4-beta-galactosidase